MKKYLITLLIAPCLVPLLITPSWPAERGIVPIAIKDASGKQVGLYKESHALVIGASEYTNGWPRLPGVMEDIREVKSALEAQGFNVVLVQNPTQRQMEEAFKNFISKYGAGKDNRLLFYFAGHGHTMKPIYGGEMGYIVPVDAPDPGKDEGGFRERAMDMQMIEVYARRIQSKHAVFIFDSCFSGSLFAMSRAIPEAIEMKTSRPVRQFITAGTAKQTVPDKSIFRGQFVRALQGEADLNHDGYITASELGQYLEDTVTNYSKRSQTPQYGKIRDPNLDQGDFVFSLQAEIALPDVQAERKRIEEERIKLATARKNLEAQKKLDEERLKLEEERGKLAQEREQMAKLADEKRLKKQTASAPAGMVRIPGGEYMAGLDPDIALAECRKYHTDCVSMSKSKLFTDASPRQQSVRSFSIDKYEVTQAEFEKVMGSNPSYYKGSNLPVEGVTWFEADAYCKKVGKRLPTEWEWEKAAKGGSNTIYAWGDNGDMAGEYAWINTNSGHTTHPVGQKKPNGYGLYDMAGNVWEWTASDYDNRGTYKVLRGGSWIDNTHAARPAFRLPDVPGERIGNLGFRCVQ